MQVRKMLNPTIGVVGAVICTASMANTRLDVELDARSAVTDNFYYQEQQEQSVSTWLVRPSVNLLRKGRLVESSLHLGAEAASNSRSDVDDYVDYTAEANFLGGIGLQTFALGAEFQRGHDPFGTVRTEGTQTANQELDLWEDSAVRLGWQRLGQLAGTLFSEVELSASQRRYTTNRSETRFLDRNASRGAALIGYNLTAKTGIFGGASYADLEFELEDPNTGVVRSGSAVTLLAGIRWRATAKTSGEVRLGSLRREQDATGSKFSSDFWQVRVDWDASRSDQLQFTSRQTVTASYLTSAQFIELRSHTLSWEHQWNTATTSRVSGQWLDQDFVGINENDQTTVLSAQLNYALDRGFAVYGRVQEESRDSTRASRDYDRTGALVGFTLTLN